MIDDHDPHPVPQSLSAARAHTTQTPSAHNVQTASASIRTCRHPRNKSILKELAQAAINASIGGWRLSKNDHDFPARSIKLRSTVSSATFPFREPASPPSNSIQPSLKPSSIRIRGVGFFMPCDRNSASQLSRGTTSIFTGRPSKRENVAAISLGVTRCGPSSSTTLWPLQVSWSSSAATRPTSAVATIGLGLLSGCKKLGITPLLVAGATSQLEFSMNHPGRRKVIDTG